MNSALLHGMFYRAGLVAMAPEGGAAGALSGGGAGGAPGAGGTGDGGAPGAGGTPGVVPGAAGGQGTPGVGGTPAAGEPYYAGFKNAEVKGWVESYKGAYPDPEAIATKAYNLEKFVGADKAGRGIVIPKADAKPEEWEPIWSKLGRPEKPDGYKLEGDLAKDPILMKFRETAHKAGMPASHFDQTVAWYAAEMKAQQDGQRGEWEKTSAKELETTYTEWGAEKDANIELGRRAAKAFLPHANGEELTTLLNKMEGALGTGVTMKLWAAIGKGMGEHTFHAGDGNGGQGGMTQEGARVKISELKRDTEWGKKFAAGDVDAKSEWERLHKIGYPGTQAVNSQQR